MQDASPPIEIETAPHPEHAVIWLHGLGADGTDFAPIVPELGLAGGPGVRFVFPHAPFMPVTCNGGYVMRAWYDILSLAPDSRRVDEAGIRQSRQTVRALIERENARGIPCRRIFLAGFSQGGAVAYSAALTHPEALAGVIALSTYLPDRRLLAEEATAANRATPILAIHGTADDVVSLSLGTQARDFLTARGYDLEWHEFPLPHTVCAEEIALIGAWLRARLAGD
jgi:phospholipase/carboxylesterase